MRLFDIAMMALHNLRRRPFRTALNLFGITLGTIIILLTAAGGDGVKQALYSLIENSGYAREIQVFANYERAAEPTEAEWTITGDMSDERRQRMEQALKQSLIDKRNYSSDYKMLDTEALTRIEEFENVKAVVPNVTLWFRLRNDDFSQMLSGQAASPLSIDLSKRLLAGDILQSDDAEGVLIHELLAYKMGYVTDEEVKRLVGKEITAEFRGGGRGFRGLAYAINSKDDWDSEQRFDDETKLLGAMKKLIGDVDLSTLTDEQKELIRSLFSNSQKDERPPEALHIRNFKISGVFYGSKKNPFDLFRNYFGEPESHVLFHPLAATDIQVNVSQQDAFYSAAVSVGSFRDVEQVETKIEALGFRTMSVHSMIENIDNQIARVCRIIYFIALAVLVITAIGISNTLIISVLERTPEFGIMKSLGAKNRHILLLMLFEGLVLGCIAAGLALVFSYVIAKLGHRILRSYVEGRVDETVAGELFAFSVPSIALAFGAAIVICCIAGILPAWRAARLDPIVAMHRN